MEQYLLRPLIMVTVCLLACQAPQPASRYKEALETTAGAARLTQAREKEALQRFYDFYARFAADAIEKGFDGVYADRIYFRDPYREVSGSKETRAYFLRTTEAIEECTFQIAKPAIIEGGDYYFRWNMHLILKRDKKKKIEIPGMSHVRYDKDGRIVFHQDYWDSSLVLEQFPIMGYVIRKIRASL